MLNNNHIRHCVVPTKNISIFYWNYPLLKLQESNDFRLDQIRLVKKIGMELKVDAMTKSFPVLHIICICETGNVSKLEKAVNTYQMTAKHFLWERY